MIGREQMIALNRRQGDFYDKVWAGEDAAAQKGVGSGYSENETINWISRIWATMRDAHSQASERAGVSARIRGVQAAWVAEKQGQSFFEIGCFSGSSKTFDLIGSVTPRARSAQLATRDRPS